MAHDKSTLHAAIEIVLTDARASQTAQEIAQTVNTRRLYVRGDGSPIPASQIKLRVKNYPHLFERNGTQISLVATEQSWNSAAKRRDPPVIERAEQSAAETDTSMLLDSANFQPVNVVETRVADLPGLYAIRVRKFDVLPEPFCSYARLRQDRLIYIGEAKTSLRKRLGQELWATGLGTFFRSIGAILGKHPIRGSLVGMHNQNNYKFAQSDEEEIVRWINQNLEVSWILLDRNIHETEVRLIQTYGPLLNITGNPRKLSEVTDLRNECRRIAREVVLPSIGK